MYREARDREGNAKKKRRILATLTAAAMVTATLAGCGNSGGSGSSGGSANNGGGSADSGSSGGSGGAQEITWMFWDDLDATEDLISLDYKETIE